MAKLKSSARKPISKSGNERLQDKADKLSRSLVESAQQIWLAGVGAFGRAQEEGTRLFEALVSEGLNLEKTARKSAGGHVDAVRDVVEDRVGQVRDRATDTWDRLEKVFEQRVQRALQGLGVPNRDDLRELNDRVNELNHELRAINRQPVAKKAANTTPAKKAGGAPARKAGAKKTAVKKAPARAVTKAAMKKSATAGKTAKSRGGKAALPSVTAPHAPSGSAD